MKRGIRNNNPLNIRHSADHWQGAREEQTDKAFVQFTSMAYGYRAVFVVLYTYQKRYGINTIASMISRYAPACENHTKAYIEAVSDYSGVPATSHITTTNRDVMIPIVAAMSRVENGEAAVMSEVEAGWKMFITDYRNRLV